MLVKIQCIARFIEKDELKIYQCTNLHDSNTYCTSIMYLFRLWFVSGLGAMSREMLKVRLVNDPLPVLLVEVEQCAGQDANGGGEADD